VANLKACDLHDQGRTANARAAFEKAVSLKCSRLLPGGDQPGPPGRAGQQADAAKQRFEKLLERTRITSAPWLRWPNWPCCRSIPMKRPRGIEKGSAANPEAINPALKLGTHYLRIKQAPKALTLARKFQTANPTNADLLELLGQAQVATKDVTGALETYSKLVNVLPKVGAGADAPGRRSHAPEKRRAAGRRPQACSRAAAGLRSGAPWPDRTGDAQQAATDDALARRASCRSRTPSCQSAMPSKATC
jgi:tetratricopeptide (TPR) repeat protein